MFPSSGNRWEEVPNWANLNHKIDPVSQISVPSEYQTIAEVQKLSNLKCNTPQPELVGRYIFFCISFNGTTSVVQWSEFLATDSEVPGSIPSPTTFSEK
jgi:hypothetical protein